MPEQPITYSATEDMRDVLLEQGFEAARNASPEAIHNKIEKWFSGGVAAFLQHYGH
jgi:hypothetical protein